MPCLFPMISRSFLSAIVWMTLEFQIKTIQEAMVSTPTRFLKRIVMYSLFDVQEIRCLDLKSHKSRLEKGCRFRQPSLFV